MIWNVTDLIFMACHMWKKGLDLRGAHDKKNSPDSLCKYLVKNRFRAGPPTNTDGNARGQFWRTACLNSVAEDSSDPPEDDLGLGKGGESVLLSPSVSLCEWRLTLGHDKSRGCIWTSSMSFSTEAMFIYFVDLVIISFCCWWRTN